MRITLIPPLDRLDRDDRSLLLYDGTLLSLGPIGAAVTKFAVDGIGFDELLDLMLDLFGPPDGDARAFLGAAVDELVASHVLQVVTD
ncbi:hypothetical protein [Tessaracoccus palaemonis]|uniref:Coenzyme PQQ synthesis protein D (PqqD) n=1 Tax=Tessaracoccus palaemonis TaxID=2829499 RepID=A0ABX8SKI7_9ACTN|nr:hypothetical protein [Tessaracoccus palaemonis]QXT62940.1 hypothetical protein KDB89_00140 [Tessaracoccus palaemonis]